MFIKEIWEKQIPGLTQINEGEKMTKRYRLKKDLLGLKAGAIFEFNKDHNLFMTDTPCSFPVPWNFRPHDIEKYSDFFEEIKEERWKPKIKEEFFLFIPVDDGVDCRATMPVDLNFSKEPHYEFGNCFKTREQAIEASRRVKETLRKYQEELNNA